MKAKVIKNSETPIYRQFVRKHIWIISKHSTDQPFIT